MPSDTLIHFYEEGAPKIECGYPLFVRRGWMRYTVDGAVSVDDVTHWLRPEPPNLTPETTIQAEKDWELIQ